MPSLPIGNVHFHYDRAGTGAPVVFVHGGFATLHGPCLDPSGRGATGKRRSPPVSTSLRTTAAGAVAPGVRNQGSSWRTRRTTWRPCWTSYTSIPPTWLGARPA